MADWREFKATNEPGTCLWCGRKLRWQSTIINPETGNADQMVVDGKVRTDRPRTWRRYDKPGDYGDGSFCGLRCGYMFGVRLADLGRRLHK